MIKELSYSAYILPVRDGQVALLKYGENGYGPSCPRKFLEISWL